MESCPRRVRERVFWGKRTGGEKGPSEIENSKC